MGINPKKLQAFAQGGEQDDGQDGGPEKPAKGGKQDNQQDKEHEAEEEGEGGDDKFGHLLPLLESNAEFIQEAVDQVNPDILDDVEAEVDPQDEEALQASVDELDEQLRSAMKDAFAGGLSEDDAHSLADHLESEGLVDDSGLVAGWFQRIASLV